MKDYYDLEKLIDRSNEDEVMEFVLTPLYHVAGVCLANALAETAQKDDDFLKLIAKNIAGAVKGTKLNTEAMKKHLQNIAISHLAKFCTDLALGAVVRGKIDNEKEEE